MHTDWSDGRATLEQMVAAAGRMGHEYVAVSDHSKSLAMAGGLDEERVRRQWERIEELNAGGGGPRILRACEVDILADGALDFEDDFLAEFDWVTASLHSGLSQPSERITARLLAAIESPHVDVIGHPTGRMLGRRAGSRFDAERVFERAAATGTCLEINAQPRRLDLPDHLARQAIAAGVMLVIGSDAHSPAELGFRRFGVTVARRAGARAADIANTRPFAELAALRAAQAAG
jgi:DNA polymerase (family 10)